MKPREIERPLSPYNAVLYGQIVSLELALLECNQMGIDVERVDYTDFKRPRLIVRDNHVTQRMMKTGKANNYGFKNRYGQRVYLNHAEIKGVRIVWEANQF